MFPSLNDVNVRKAIWLKDFHGNGDDDDYDVDYDDDPDDNAVFLLMSPYKAPEVGDRWKSLQRGDPLVPETM